MSNTEIVIGILLFIMALFLIVSILMQSGKSKKLSGTIAGGAETFFGKQKGQAIDKTLSKVTNIVALVFVVLILILLFADAKNDADAKKAAEDAAASQSEVTESTATSGNASSAIVEESADEASEPAAEVSAPVAEASEAVVTESSAVEESAN